MNMLKIDFKIGSNTFNLAFNEDKLFQLVKIIF